MRTTKEQREALVKWLRDDPRLGTHWDGCVLSHLGCAVLALLEDLEEAETERDENMGVIQALRRREDTALERAKKARESADFWETGYGHESRIRHVVQAELAAALERAEEASQELQRAYADHMGSIANASQQCGRTERWERVARTYRKRWQETRSELSEGIGTLLAQVFLEGCDAEKARLERDAALERARKAEEERDVERAVVQNLWDERAEAVSEGCSSCPEHCP